MYWAPGVLQNARITTNWGSSKSEPSKRLLNGKITGKISYWLTKSSWTKVWDSVLTFILLPLYYWLLILQLGTAKGNNIMNEAEEQDHMLNNYKRDFCRLVFDDYERWTQGGACQRIGLPVTRGKRKISCKCTAQLDLNSSCINFRLHQTWNNQVGFSTFQTNKLVGKS